MNTKCLVLWILYCTLIIVACSSEGFISSKEVVPYEGPEITFAIIGDYGLAGEKAEKVSQLVDSWKPSFIITTGDNNYPNGAVATLHQNITAYYEDYIYNPDAPDFLRCYGKASSDQQNRFFPSLGNHDYQNPIGNNPYLSYFTLPGREDFYDFVQGSVHFFCLDSQSALEEKCCDHEQSKWLKTQISNSTSAFKIVYFHHAPYSSIPDRVSENLRWPFEKWGIDAVLTGHNHLYERWTPTQAGLPFYITNGIGGSPFLKDCEKDEKQLPNHVLNCIDHSHGAIRGVISTNKVEFSLFLIDEANQSVDAWLIE